MKNKHCFEIKYGNYIDLHSEKHPNRSESKSHTWSDNISLPVLAPQINILLISCFVVLFLHQLVSDLCFVPVNIRGRSFPVEIWKVFQVHDTKNYQKNLADRDKMKSLWRVHTSPEGVASRRNFSFPKYTETYSCTFGAFILKVKPVVFTGRWSQTREALWTKVYWILGCIWTRVSGLQFEFKFSLPLCFGLE